MAGVILVRRLEGTKKTLENKTINSPWFIPYIVDENTYNNKLIDINS